MKHIQKILERIGLSENEGLIYLALLNLGSGNIMDISRTTKMNRPLVYKTLDSLLEKSLVSQIKKGKRTHYSAESPDTLDYLLIETRSALEQILPELKGAYQAAASKPIAKFFEGKGGIMATWDDLASTLGKGDVYYRYSSSVDANKRKDYLSPRYKETRSKKQIGRLVITSEEISKIHQADLDMETKTIPKESGLFDYGITQLIYDKKVAFIDYGSETVFTIENEAIAEFQKAIFKTLYKKL
jgi:sugar-specific transcriptional regulator TrmB